ncbi:hypothetical protein HYT24_00400 [Candidatus Pacearchaeota archaeon]|nr:hypothetical protein [Candidatus Pacearchaeota archaeon]
MEKLNQVKFGIAGGITFALLILLVEIVLWIVLVPFYNNMMSSLYGVPGLDAFDLFKTLIVSLVVGFLIGFSLNGLFAWIYNKLLVVKVK